MECTCGPNAGCSSCPRNTRLSITQAHLDLIAEAQDQLSKSLKGSPNYVKDYAIALGVLVDKLSVLDPPHPRYNGTLYTNNSSSANTSQP